MPKKPKTRRFEGFAAFDERGNLVWGSTRIREEDARYFFDHHSPDPSGNNLHSKVKKIVITTKD